MESAIWNCSVLSIYFINLSESHADYSIIPVPNPAVLSRAFTLEEMMEATNSFSRKIGQRGFGSVFFGKLKEGTEIAVKVLTFFSQQGVHQFQNEVNYSNSAPL